MNIYDHEDAFKDANRYAGRKTKLGDALKTVTDQNQARVVILDLQEKYEAIFEAFVAGVEWARQDQKNKDTVKK